MEVIEVGDIVLSTKGRDKDCKLLVIKVENNRATVCDGSIRKTIKPKLKNLKHLQIIKKNALGVQAKKINSVPFADKRLKALIKGAIEN